MNRHDRPGLGRPLAHCEEESTNSESPFFYHAESRHTSHAPRDCAVAQAGYPSFTLATRPGLGATKLPAAQGDLPGAVPANQEAKLPRCAIMWLAQTMAVAQEGLDRKVEPDGCPYTRPQVRSVPQTIGLAPGYQKGCARPSQPHLTWFCGTIESNMRATPKGMMNFPSPGVPCL